MSIWAFCCHIIFHKYSAFAQRSSMISTFTAHVQKKTANTKRQFNFVFCSSDEVNKGHNTACLSFFFILFLHLCSQAGGLSAQQKNRAGCQPHIWTPRMQPEMIWTLALSEPEKVSAEKHGLAVHSSTYRPACVAPPQGCCSD